MNRSFSSIEMRSRRLKAFALRVCASVALAIGAVLLLTLSPQAVYGQG